MTMEADFISRRVQEVCEINKRAESISADFIADRHGFLPAFRSASR